MRYYVNKNPQVGGEHEVHEYSCSYLPNADNCLYLGEFSSCQAAVVEAGRHYREVDGCFYCCNPCHHR